MSSVWWQGVKRREFDSLKENKKTDVLIVGGGIAGILCAYYLKQRGVDCILIEAGRICSGITKNTTAKISVQHGLIYDKLISKYGRESAALYLKAQKDACREYERLAGKIDCDYEKRPSYVYSLCDRGKIEREAEAIEMLGGSASVVDEIEIPVKTVGAVCVEDEAQFNPLKLLFSISENLPIFEETKLFGIKPHVALTNRCEITYDKAIIATHFPILNKHGLYFMKLYQHRSYVIALDGAPALRGMYVDEAERGLSYRSYKNLLLLGGGSHRTGKKGGNWQELEAFAKEHYSGAKIISRFATQDCMSLDGIPYIGQYSPSVENLFVCSGFNKWGMSSAMVAANLLSDLIMGKKNDYSRLFSPSRSMLHRGLAVNALETIVSLLTPTAPRCPHLGCALKYNRAEHSWDCPCHGSRFTESGELIDNPATDDKRNM